MLLINKFIKLSLKDKLLVIQIFFLLNIVFIVIRLVRLKYLHKYLVTTITYPNSDLKQGYRIGHLINQISKFSLSQKNCLTDSIVGKLIYRKYKLPNTLYIGVMKDKNKLKAHAYLTNQINQIVIGNTQDKFSVILTLADTGMDIDV